MRLVVRLLDAVRWALYGVGFAVLGGKLWKAAAATHVSPLGRLGALTFVAVMGLGFVTIMSAAGRELRRLYVTTRGEK